VDEAAAQNLRGVLVGGRYTLAKRVGQGGFGVVYQADDREGGRCAVKMIPFSHWTERGLAQREAAMLERHAHPGVVAFHGTGRHGATSAGYVYIAMELGEGSLYQRIHGRGPMPAAEVRDVALQVLDVLEHLHGRGVVHGDLKTANLVRAKGRWKLCDLGSATEAGSLADREAWCSGTPEVMAPEVFDGRAGPPADLWALGLLIHECATRRSPFEVEGAGHETIARIVRETEPTLDPQLPAAFVPIVLGCLRRDPARRLTSAEVRAALAAMADDAVPPRESWHGLVATAVAACAVLAAVVWEIAR
jgi:serine/threonine-protein kinase